MKRVQQTSSAGLDGAIALLWHIMKGQERYRCRVLSDELKLQDETALGHSNCSRLSLSRKTHAGDTAGEVKSAHLTAGVLVVARFLRECMQLSCQESMLFVASACRAMRHRSQS